MARRGKTGRRAWRLYLVATLALAAIAWFGWQWWDMLSWRPDESVYPEQGAYLGDRHGRISFPTVAALGGAFVYLDASHGESGKDAGLARNIAAARRAGLKVGAVHIFDPCISADRQSANFVTMVPRDAQMLPPAIGLYDNADQCPSKVSDAAVESELMTFINQVEMHAGQRVILKLSPAFEERYHTATSIDRDLWLMRDRYDPDYAQRPWLLWSANGALQTDISAEPVEWVVVQP